MSTPKSPNTILAENVVMGLPTHNYIPPPAPPETQSAKTPTEPASQKAEPHKSKS